MPDQPQDSHTPPVPQDNIPRTREKVPPGKPGPKPPEDGFPPILEWKLDWIIWELDRIRRALKGLALAAVPAMLVICLVLVFIISPAGGSKKIVGNTRTPLPTASRTPTLPVPKTATKTPTPTPTRTPTPTP